MLRRLRWMGAGAALGAGGMVWAQRKARSLTDRYRPSTRVSVAVDRVAAWPSEVRAALEDGRQAMRRREAELRAEAPRTDPRRVSGDPRH